MKIVVQKFGGSSLATPELRDHALDQIVRAKDDGFSVVVVVSAMGRQGDPYATDTLLQLVDSQAASPRELDLLLSCGEIISSAVLAQQLVLRNQKAQALTGAQSGIVTNALFGDARIETIDPSRILSLLEQGIIPIVAGFQGMTRHGDIATLGRGGSDTTAAALGVVLRAERIDIFTDVDGIKAADPRLIPRAPTLKRIAYREAMELANAGAKVIHPRAVEIAMTGHIPIAIRSLLSDSIGTLISDIRRTGRLESFDKVVTGIAQVTDCAWVIVNLSDKIENGDVCDIFAELADEEVSVDMINITQERIAFLVGGKHTRKTERVLERRGLTSCLKTGFSKVSAIGAGMHGVPGVMARILRALHSVDVTVYQTTDSHAHISCLVREEALSVAVHALYHEFGLEEGEGLEDDIEFWPALDRHGNTHEARPVN